MTANNGLTTTEVINVNNIPVSEKPVLYVTPSGTIGSETSQTVTFTLSSPNCNNAVYYYNNGDGWVQIDGDTFVISKAGDYNLNFKAVCGELESYPSPTYSVKLTADYYTAVFKTTVLESKDSDTGSVALGGVKVYVDDKFVGTTDDDGKVSCLLKQGEHSVLFDNETFNRTMKVDVTEDVEFNAPMVALDLNKDGCINAKDYVMIREIADSQLTTLYSEIFINFYNEFDSTFSYQN